MKSLLRLIRILTPAERRRLALILLGITLVAISDVAGVVSVAPFLAVIVNPGSTSIPGIAQLRAFSGIVDDNAFVMFVGLSSMAIIIMANLLNALVSAAHVRFTNRVGYSLSRRLLRAYLKQDQVTLLVENTTELGKNILSEVDRAVVGVISPALNLIARGIAALFVILFLVLIDPVLAISLALVFGGIYVLVYLSTQRWLARTGRAAVEGNKVRYRIVSEAFGALRELRLYGHVDSFASRFDKPALTYAEATATSLIVGQIPRFVLEPLAFGCIIFMVIYSIKTGNSLATVVPLAGMFAFAGYRLLPAFQHMFSAFASVRFYAPALRPILDHLSADHSSDTESAQRAISAFKFQRTIEFEKVCFSYPERPDVLMNLDLTIKANATVGFIGRTGSGKTTIVSLILGLLHPTSGTIEVDGLPLVGDRLAAWQRRVGYVPQDIFLIDGTVASNIALGIPDDQIDLASVERAARLANVHDFITGSLPSGYQTTVGERGARLSGGQRQRIGIARALYHDPDVIVLDEATSGLDQETEQTLMEAIDSFAGKRTLIVIAHRPATLRQADIVYVIDNGRITASGLPTEVMPQLNSDLRQVPAPAVGL